MATGKFIAYYRVSTERQGTSGLGLEAQRKAVSDYLNGGRWTLVQEFTEVESGKHNDRPELAKAFAACRVHRAKLVIAKLDRLSRNAAFLLNLRDAGVDFVCADMPDANQLTIGILALVAQHEREAISARTIAALAAAKARGRKLGGIRPNNDPSGLAHGPEANIARADSRATDLAPMIADIRAGGITSLGGIANELNSRGIEAARGGRWSAVQVQRVLARL